VTMPVRGRRGLAARPVTGPVTRPVTGPACAEAELRCAWASSSAIHVPRNVMLPKCDGVCSDDAGVCCQTGCQPECRRTRGARACRSGAPLILWTGRFLTNVATPD
jgi:hypothetical protein